VIDFPVYGPDGGAAVLTRASDGCWPWVITALGIVIVVLGGLLLT
jgi:hypothetical protein